MIQPPERPQKGQPIASDWFLQFYDYCKSLECRGDLRTTIVRRDRSGTVIRAVRSGATPITNRQDAIIAQIDTDYGDGTYEATEQKNAGGTFSDRTTAQGMKFDSGTNGALREIHGRKGIPVGSYVEVLQVANTAGGPLWYFAGQPANTPFEVDVEQDNGAGHEGDGTTQCDYTYTVKTISTSPQTLLTGATPTWARPATGMLVAGTHGRAMYQADGTIILIQVDEVPDVDGPCAE